MPAVPSLAQNHDLMRESTRSARCAAALSPHLRASPPMQIGATTPRTHQFGNDHDDAMTSLAERIERSFKASFGDIVFGMEDGTVSIFGLVFGVAATTTDTRVVLDRGHDRRDRGGRLDDGGRVSRRRDRARSGARPRRRERSVAIRLERDSRALARGRHFSCGGRCAGRRWRARIRGLPRSLRAAYQAKLDDDEASPLAHALWMFVADILAALVPVLPFAFLPMDTRATCRSVHRRVLVVLGIGRAKIGKRRVLSTTLQTLGIAAARGWPAYRRQLFARPYPRHDARARHTCYATTASTTSTIAAPKSSRSTRARSPRMCSAALPSR